ncbi:MULTISPECIES: hypothetical protein [unclassified Methanosarcina]|uniref:hypothetical protein n=1 Tax=unclassified Methanosarcina TaxID=2644672 RepID=UPI0006218080|nr:MULTISPECIES: hypothetical protein [unclassified Methanosarcina]KKG09431.1 hypothetical protein EO92_11570 [Methanosarcina sp. 2.H.A.1B.4]KKH48238.1 hypothetical protein EO93_15745 [Methanosarcina sp. 1.H.A.2.2]
MTACREEDYKLLATNFHAEREGSQCSEEDIAPDFSGFSQLTGTGTRTASWKTESAPKNLFETRGGSQIYPSKHSMLL